MSSIDWKGILIVVVGIAIVALTVFVAVAPSFGLAVNTIIQTFVFGAFVALMAAVGIGWTVNKVQTVNAQATLNILKAQGKE